MNDYGLCYAQNIRDNDEGPDPFYEDKTFIRCDLCHGHVPKSDALYLDGNVVCDDCLSDFCKTKFDELGDEYIENNAEDFYINWWFDDLSRAKKLDVVKQFYNAVKCMTILSGDAERAKNMKLDEKQFCIQSENWVDFVKEMLQ